MSDFDYYKKFRCIKDSEVAHARPVVRELWDYILREVCWKDTDKLKRGQTCKTYKQISDDLHWMEGCVRKCYTIKQCRTALAWLVARNMVGISQSTSRIIITVCKYDDYNTAGNIASNGAGPSQGTSHRTTQGTLIEKKEEVRRDTERENAHAQEVNLLDFKKVDGISDFMRKLKNATTWANAVPDHVYMLAIQSWPQADLAAALRHIVMTWSMKEPDSPGMVIQKALERSTDAQKPGKASEPSERDHWRMKDQLRVLEELLTTIPAHHDDRRKEIQDRIKTLKHKMSGISLQPSRKPDNRKLIESLVEKVSNSADWGFEMSQIYDKYGKDIAKEVGERTKPNG